MKYVSTIEYLVFTGEDAQKFISQLSPTSIRNEELETIIEKQILTHGE